MTRSYVKRTTGGAPRNSTVETPRDRHGHEKTTSDSTTRTGTSCTDFSTTPTKMQPGGSSQRTANAALPTAKKLHPL